MARGNWNSHHSGDVCAAIPDPSSRAALVQRCHDLYALNIKLIAAVSIMRADSDRAVCEKVADQVLQAARDAGVMVEA